MRVRAGIVAALLITIVTAACGDDTTATTEPAAGCALENLNLVTPGTLTIATGEPVFPPWMEDDDPTNQMGFEGAVAYGVAEKLGFSADQVVWVRTGFDEAIAPGPKSFDFNIQQYSITADRDQVVDFSRPYYLTRQALVAFADSPIVEANTVADLQAFKLGAQIGTTSLDYIEDVIQPTESAAVYDTNADAKSGLDAQQVDGLLFDLPTAYFITAVEIPDATIVGQFEAIGAQPDEFGLLFADGNPLVSCVDEALNELEEDGSLARFEATWLAQEGDIKTITP